MSKVVSLVDSDVVIVQAKCIMNDNEIKEQEEKLTEKLGKKVVILPQQFDLLEYKDNNKQTIKNTDEIKFYNSDGLNRMNIRHGGIKILNVKDIGYKHINELDKETYVNVPLDMDRNELEKFVKEQLLNIKAGIETTINKIAEPKYKVLNKEDYIKRKVDRVMKHQEEMWNKVSKGGKYVIYTEDSDNKTHYYSLDYFYNKPILGCNISK